ncbi:MAG: sigma-70 family RNA polymerase sigma factor [Pyrinomonadaceae bacterium]
MAESILKRISTGDNTAVQECLDTYGGLIWSLARRMLPDANDAEDAVQEIFVEIWKNAERFDEEKSSETTFIAMIARRRLIDRLRKIDRQPNADSFEEMVTEPVGKDGREVYVSIEAKRAASAMNELRPEQKKVLQLSIVEGYSHSEIADLLEIPLGTVKTYARRGLIEVREILASEREKFDQGVTA